MFRLNWDHDLILLTVRVFFYDLVSRVNVHIYIFKIYFSDGEFSYDFSYTSIRSSQVP